MSIELTVKDLYIIDCILSSDTFNSQTVVQNLLKYVLILVFIFLSSQTGKACNSIFFKFSILVEIPLCFSNSLSSSVIKEITLFYLSSALNVITYPLFLGIIKTNGLISLYKSPIKYIELAFVLTSFQITIIPTLTFQTFIGFFEA